MIRSQIRNGREGASRPLWRVLEGTYISPCGENPSENILVWQRRQTPFILFFISICWAWDLQISDLTKVRVCFEIVSFN